MEVKVVPQLDKVREIYFVCDYKPNYNLYIGCISRSRKHTATCQTLQQGKDQSIDKYTYKRGIYAQRYVKFYGREHQSRSKQNLHEKKAVGLMLKFRNFCTLFPLVTIRKRKIQRIGPRTQHKKDMYV